MRRSRAQRVTTVFLLVGLFALAVAGAVGALFRDPPVKTASTTSSTAPTTTLPPISNLGDVGKQLGTLAEQGRHVDYSAVYSVVDPALPAGLVQTVELWRRGNNYRQDIVERTGSSTNRHTTILGDQPRTCETANGQQTCMLIAAGTPTYDLPGAFVRRVVLATHPPTLTVKSAAVAGYQATCFEAVGDNLGKPTSDGKQTSGTGELCLNGDGTLLRLVLQGATIQLTTITSVVPASAFDTNPVTSTSASG
jgi:hypothetical protein